MATALNLALFGGLLCLFAGLFAGIFGTMGIMPDDNRQSPDQQVTYRDLADFEMRAVTLQHDHLKSSKLGRVANRLVAVGTAMVVLAGGARLVFWLLFG